MNESQLNMHCLINDYSISIPTIILYRLIEFDTIYVYADDDCGYYSSG